MSDVVCICVVYYVSMMFCCVCCCFVFQAEDGIRYLVRSRGLGDVYKRQESAVVRGQALQIWAYQVERRDVQWSQVSIKADASVSYTHLTLPTSDLV